MQALFAVCARMHYRGFDDAIFVCLDPFYYSFTRKIQNGFMSFQKTYQDDDYCHMIINWKNSRTSYLQHFKKDADFSVYLCSFVGIGSSQVRQGLRKTQ